MRYYLWEMRPYFWQVAGQLVLGSIAGIIMNTAIVLPAILLGRAIDAALAFERGAVGPGPVGWAVLALLPVPVAMLLAKATGRWVADRTTASRQANASLTTALQEQLAGIRVLRLFGRTGAAVERVDRLSGEQADTNLALVRLRGGLRPVYTTLMSAGVLFVVWQGGEKAVNGAMTVGAFIAYLELYLRFVNRGFRVPQMINSIQGGAAAYARLRPLLAPPLSLANEPPGASFRAGHLVGMQEPVPAPPAVPSGPMAVALHGVTFRYSTATAPALYDMCLDIPAGPLVAVTGPVGSG